jgi:site-specific DNA-methyltransferase (adenine-specific)
MSEKLILGDCLEEMEKLESGSIDMVLTDPPYGTTACKWDAVIPLWPMWLRLKRLIKPNGAIVMTASQPFTTTLIASNMEMFKYEWVWDKKRITNPMLAKKMPLKQHENVVVFYKKQPTYNPQPYKKNTVGLMSDKNLNKSHTSDNYGDTGIVQSDNKAEFGYPRSLLTQIPIMNNLSKDKSGLHPTQKPVALMEYLIKTYTNEGETVLDFTMGSGTTGVACQNLNRNFIGIEKDEKYFKIAQERINATP